METYFNIAGLRLKCGTPFPLTVGEESRPFLCDPAAPDVTVVYEPASRLPQPPQNCVQMGGRSFCGNEIWHRLSKNQPNYAHVRWDGSAVYCRYLPGMLSELNTSRNLWELIGLENLLLRHGGVLLHSSLIRWQGRAILFTAPSGTGKSTQASLWEQFAGAEILNGDRAALRRVDGKWTAFGLPYAGSSGIYRQEWAEIAGIICLSQGKTNEIRSVSPVEALRHILPECTIHRWDADFSRQATDLLLQLAQQVNIYALACLPDRGAVELLRQTIAKEVSL